MKRRPTNEALELLANSPYKDKLANAGLFLKALQERAPELKNLIRPHWEMDWRQARRHECPRC